MLLKKIIRLKIIIIAVYFNQIYSLNLSKRSTLIERIECVGGFVVCGFPHLMHASCYDRWSKGCPLCVREEKDPAQEVHTDTIYLDKRADNDCAICTVSCCEKPDIYPSSLHFTPTAPPLEASTTIRTALLPTEAPILRRSSSFYDQYYILQKEITDTKNPKARDILMLKARRMLTGQFRYLKK